MSLRLHALDYALVTALVQGPIHLQRQFAEHLFGKPTGQPRRGYFGCPGTHIGGSHYCSHCGSPILERLLVSTLESILESTLESILEEITEEIY